MNRLNTQINESYSKSNDNIQIHDLGMNFYKLPDLRSPLVKRERILTQNPKPSPILKQSRFHFKNVKNISKNIEGLQKQYFKYYPKKQDSIKEDIRQYPIQYNSRARVKTDYDHQNKRIDQSPSILQKKWEVKVLPQKKSPRHFEGLIPSPKHKQNKNNEYRDYQDRQKELYGIKENPFAFVNSKLQEIKRSEKYYPRGYINSYRDALFRRRKCKNMIQDRRQKLRNMLYQEDVKYGVI